VVNDTFAAIKSSDLNTIRPAQPLADFGNIHVPEDRRQSNFVQDKIERGFGRL